MSVRGEIIALRFGRHELRPAQRELRSEGAVVPLGARAFDLLVALTERRDRIVTKAELLDLVWPGLVVEENNLQVQVGALRKLLGNGAIATIPGRGYRFTMAVEAIAGPASTAVGAPPAAASVDRPPTNLPGCPHPLTGRDSELRALLAAVGAHRMLTVVGAAGLGKTALARAAAHAAIDHFPAGVWWIDLAGLPREADATAIAQAAARAVGAPLPDGDAPQRLARALLQRRLLLVLDNCEHVAAGAAHLAAAIGAEASGVHVLATSQVVLHAPGEQVWQLEALAVPPEHAAADTVRASPAFRLFVQRATKADHRFAVADADLPRAAALCRALDGNALAIELAAARAPRLGIGALHDRLADRLQWLRGGATAQARHQSVRAALDWSWSLLGTPERTVLRRLAVFAGSFALETAQQVVADDGLDAWAVLDALVVLAEHSLLQLEPGEPVRYRLLDATRAHAAEQLAAASETARLELAHGAALAALGPLLRRSFVETSRRTFVQRHSADRPDLAAAFDRACDRGDASVAAAVGLGLAEIDGVPGTAARMAAAWKLVPHAATALDRARLWTLIAPQHSVALPELPRLEAARARLDAWREVGDDREIYLALARVAAEQARGGDLESARATAAAARAAEDASWPAALRMATAEMDSEIAMYDPTPGAGLAAARRMAQVAAETGDSGHLLRARFRLADHATGDGDTATAIAAGEDCVALGADAHSPLTLGLGLANLCCAYLQASRDGDARAAAARALPLLRPNGYAPVLFNHLALIAARAGDAASAARLLGHADRWYARYQSPRRQATEARTMEPALAAIVSALGAEAGERLRAEGAKLSDAKADELAADALRSR